jgi:esterase/lipase superfamily enzyme
MTTVLFATNRLADSSVPGGFGALMAQEGPANITYGTAAVENGRLAAVADIQPGHWPDATLGMIARSPVSLVTVHGFDYSFEDSLIRAASLGDLYGVKTVIAPCWPSAGRLIEFGLPDDAYLHDQKMAAASGPAIAHMLTTLALIRGYQAPGARMTGLFHSMGSFVLGGALDALDAFGMPPAPLFDDALLAAADERADSFDLADHARLGRLSRVAVRQTLYFAQDDEVLALSAAINGAARLGQDGPIDRQNADLFPPEIFRFVDCTASDPVDLDPDDSHQYYRNSPVVVADIAAVVTGRAAAATSAERSAA